MIALLLLAMATASGVEDIPALFREARQAEQRRDFTLALEKYNAVLAADPSIAEVWANKGLVLYELDRHREALRAFEKAAQLKPELANAQYFRGLEHLRFGEPRRALEPLGLALKSDSASARIRYALANAHAELGNHERAIELYSDVLRREPGMEEARYALAIAYLNRSKAVARRLADSGSGYGKLLLANYFAAAGADDAAGDYYRQALQSLPDSGEVRQAARAFYAAIGHTDKAESVRELPAGVRLDPLAAAIAGYNEAQYRRAYGLLAQASGDRALYWLSLTCRALAREQLVESIQRSPDSFQSHLLLADLARHSGDSEGASSQYEKAARLAPANAEVQLLYIRFVASRDPNLALEWARAAAQKLPGNAEIETEYGALLLKTGDAAAAAGRFRQALARRPGLAAARAGLADSHAAAGAWSEAIAEMERAANADPDGSWHYRLATWYRKAGRTAEAQQAFAVTARIKAAQREREVARFLELSSAREGNRR